jgi:hypothetical protein
MGYSWITSIIQPDNNLCTSTDCRFNNNKGICIIPNKRVLIQGAPSIRNGIITQDKTCKSYQPRPPDVALELVESYPLYNNDGSITEEDPDGGIPQGDRDYGC